MPTTIILTGGFLGAGKTSLIAAITALLNEKQHRVGIITNDQATALVDTAWLNKTAATVTELSGSCFCCNYDGFSALIRDLERDSRADIILAEPVGSCTDLSATLLQPLKQHWGVDGQVAPLTVLADPFRLAAILEGGLAGLHPSAAYIYRKQLEESDCILVTKLDLLSDAAADRLLAKTRFLFPGQAVMACSARTGAGLEEWLQYALHTTITGTKILEIDYDRYAEGEAVLGWLNATLHLRCREADWQIFFETLLDGYAREVADQQLSVGHIKLLLETEDELVIGNLSGELSVPTIRGRVNPGAEARLIINARLGCSPGLLDRLTRQLLTSTLQADWTVTTLAWDALQPGYPQPTHRFTKPV